MKNEREPDHRLPYEKPRLRTIPLVAEEVLGIKCKLGNGDPRGKLGAGCGSTSCLGRGGS